MVKTILTENWQEKQRGLENTILIIKVCFSAYNKQMLMRAKLSKKKQ